MYSEHYGLTGKPFQLTPDPRFYFDSQTHRKAMAYLGYGIAQGEGFIVITGDIGAGKTTLVAHLMATIDRSLLTTVQIGSTQVDGEDMLRLTAQGLGLPTEGLAKAQLIDRIERALLANVRAGKRTLLIIDEAQNLPLSALEELRMLSNLQSNGGALVQIFLLGQPEFRAKLQEAPGLEQLRQRVIATHHLVPMKSDEVGPYVQHRLSLVGAKDKSIFTDSAFDALYRHSDGVPRRLNTLAGRTLLLGAVEGRDTIDGPDVDVAAADMASDGHRTGASEPESAEPAPRPTISFGDHRPSIVPLPPRSGEDPALVRRLIAMETRLDEQDVALRRVLTLLVNWVEGDVSQRRARDTRRNSAA